VIGAKGIQPMTDKKESKQSISVLLCGNAEGALLPPFVIYRAKGDTKNIYEGYLQDSVWGTCVAISGKGWMKHQLWTEWLKCMFIPWVKVYCSPNTKVILTFDNAG
jgi:hypothetical protein